MQDHDTGQEPGTPGKIIRRFPFMRFEPAILFREVAAMLRSGVPLAQALAFASDDFGSMAAKHLDVVRQQVEQGVPFSAALAALPSRWLPAGLCATVAAGEKSGQLPTLLEEMASEHERLDMLSRRLGSALLYPLTVLLITCGVLMIMGRMFLPTYATLYQRAGGGLPLIADFVNRYWPSLGLPLLLLLGGLLAMLISLSRPTRSTAMTRWGRALAVRLPIVSGLSRALIEVRFARTLRVLLDAGVPLPVALDLCREVVGDHRAGAEIVAGADRIRQGEKPSEALAGLGFLSPAFLWFLTGSEARGDFIAVTRAMAEAAEERFLTLMELTERMLEPLATLLLGLVVGAIVLGLYQTIFGLYRLVGSG